MLDNNSPKGETSNRPPTGETAPPVVGREEGKHEEKYRRKDWIDPLL